MARKWVGQAAMGCVCILLGMVMTAQFRNVQQVGGSVSLRRTQELSVQLEKLRADNTALQGKLDTLRTQINEYQNAGTTAELAETMRQDLQNARMEAGLLEMTGPGIMLTLDLMYIVDAAGTQQPFQQVLDEDLLSIVNELNASGAEAVSINGERLVATSEIRNAGKFININTHSYSVPFVVQAIGVPKTLEAGLNLAGGVLDSLRPYYDIFVAQQEEVVIPPYGAEIHFRYARPVNEAKP